MAQNRMLSWVDALGSTRRRLLASALVVSVSRPCCGYTPYDLQIANTADAVSSNTYTRKQNSGDRSTSAATEYVWVYVTHATQQRRFG